MTLKSMILAPRSGNIRTIIMSMSFTFLIQGSAIQSANGIIILSVSQEVVRSFPK